MQVGLNADDVGGRTAAKAFWQNNGAIICLSTEEHYNRTSVPPSTTNVRRGGGVPNDASFTSKFPHLAAHMASIIHMDPEMHRETPEI